MDVHAQRVPVEHRRLGLDGRSVPYGVAALVVLALWAWVLPWVNDQVGWDDPTRPGEAIQVTDEVTMTVPPGWGVVSGLRTSDAPRTGERSADQVLLVKDGVVFSILQGPFEESPVRLLGQAQRITGAYGSGFHVSGQAHDVTTASGVRGVAQGFVSATGTGVVTAFVVDGRGIEIQVAGPPSQVDAARADTDAMIDSLAQDGGGS